MQREKLAERGRGTGRSPTAAGGESRRSLLCSGGAGTGCARFCSPGKCGGGVGGSRCGARQRLAAGKGKFHKLSVKSCVFASFYVE